MLDEHLRAHTRPLARSENCVFWNDYRVTVLTDRLFRVEKGAFTDEATQGVWFRDLPTVPYSVKHGKDRLTVDTGATKLVLAKEWADCRVVLGGKSKKITNDGNLLGTYRTLDCTDGGRRGRFVRADIDPTADGRLITLGTGVCSRTGVAVLDDGESLLIDANGELKSRAPAFDKYIFCYGNDYREAVRALYAIEGPAPLLPRFVFGNWWSRYNDYTEDSYLRLVDRFREAGVPLSVATVDMDWHWSDNVDRDKKITELGRNKPEYGGNNGWTGYSWNTDFFPDYKRFLRRLQERGLKVTLNLHPADGVRWWEDRYEEFARALGYDPATLERVPFNVASTEFMNAYFRILHKPFEADGVDFWWIDWQQGTESGVKNLDPLWALNHYHMLDNAKNHDLPLIMSRYCGAGAHRYPLGFTGDTRVTWGTLNLLPSFTATASNIGYTWWSHDIGGHCGGFHDGEMYARFLEFGVFNPVLRLHCTKTYVLSHEPWAYPGGAGEIGKEQLRLRYRLIPYLYSANVRTHEEGLALLEPLYYEHPDRPEAYRYPNTYFFGGQLLVAPITKKGSGGYGSVRTWIPEGEWTDFFTGEKYRGGSVRTLYRSLDSIPVLARAGAIVPMSGDAPENGAPLPHVLRVRTFSGNGSFRFVEDEGKRRAEIAFESRGGDGVQELSFVASGDKTVPPADRIIRVEFADLPAEAEIEAFADGKPIEAERLFTDAPAVAIRPDFGKKIVIRASYRKIGEMERLRRTALAVLVAADGGVAVKNNLYCEICSAETPEEYRAAVEKGAFSPQVAKKLLETL